MAVVEDFLAVATRPLLRCEMRRLFPALPTHRETITRETIGELIVTETETEILGTDARRLPDALQLETLETSL
jgi:hypothetical protein